MPKKVMQKKMITKKKIIKIPNPNKKKKKDKLKKKDDTIQIKQPMDKPIADDNAAMDWGNDFSFGDTATTTTTTESIETKQNGTTSPPQTVAQPEVTPGAATKGAPQQADDWNAFGDDAFGNFFDDQ